MPGELSVLVVGADGNLGRRIARAMHRRGLRVRRGVRKPAATGDAGHAHGEVVRADLTDAASLRAACRGVDIVVSAVQGGPDVVIDGQQQLLDAAQSAGVSRLIPSDYALDMFALDPGENWALDLRRVFDEHLMHSGMGYTILFNAGFMEAVVSPAMQMVDLDAGTLSFWGDGQNPIQLTSMNDAAAYLARIVSDPTTLNRVVEIVGQELTMPELAQAYRDATGRTLELRSKGSVEDGYAQLERLKTSHTDPRDMLPLMFQLPLVAGRGRLKNPENRNYPEVSPTTLVDVIRAEHA